jgi:hypothetical protein
VGARAHAAHPLAATADDQTAASRDRLPHITTQRTTRPIACRCAADCGEQPGGVVGSVTVSWRDLMLIC